MARPKSTSYSDEERAEIIAHVLIQVATGRFVSRVFREDKATGTGVKMPAQSTFWLWVFQDEQAKGEDRLSEKIARARESGIEALLDETVEIADDGTNDTYFDDGGNLRVNNDVIQRSRLRIDTRIKLAQMMKPKKYAAMTKIADADGEKLPVDDISRATRLAAIFAEINKRSGDAPD
jgi:hypothetical protein